MNALDAVRENMEACFIYGSYASQEIRELAGISMMSQVWIEVPAWYLWLHKVQGAFMVEAIDVFSSGEEDASFDTVRFVVRYFPPVGSGEMGALTDEERSLRVGSVFDQTGTPRFERLDEIRQGRFEAAVLEWHLSKCRETVVILLETGSVNARNVEDHCAALYEALAGLYALYCRRAPRRSFILGANGAKTKLKGVIFGKSDISWVEDQLQRYLDVESLAPYQSPPEAVRAWETLSRIEPQSMKSSGCCCCGG